MSERNARDPLASIAPEPVDIASVMALRAERATEEAARPRPVLRRLQRLNRKGQWVDVDVREFEQPEAPKAE